MSMKPMNFPIRITVTTSFILFTVFAVSIVAVLNFVESRDTILEVAKVRMGHSADLAQREVDRLIDKSFSTSKSIAALPRSIFQRETPEIVEGVLTTALNDAPEFYGIFVGFPDGSFIQAVKFVDEEGRMRNISDVPKYAVTGWRIIRPLEGTDVRTQTWRYFDVNGDEIDAGERNRPTISRFDPRLRSWYIDAQASGEPSITKAYVFASLRKPGVTISAPIHSYPGATIGVDLPLTSLSHLTNRAAPGENGVVAIYDIDGDMIAHTEHHKIVEYHEKYDSLRLVSADKIKDSRLRTARAIYQKQQEPEISFTVDGKEYIGFFQSLGAESKTLWQIVSIAAVDDFTGKLVTTLYHSLIITGIVLIFAVWGVTALAGWISVPVMRLRAMADRITEMNLSPVEAFQTPFDEIQSLRNSMERMRSALETFVRYVPRELVRDLIQSGEQVEVGGVKRDVTLLFTDIEGFTTLTEKMTPEEVMQQTSEYFERLTFAIQANRGTVDKFIGDAIMAMWNAPSDDDQHVDNACRGTLAALAVSKDLNDELEARGAHVMRTRFGLHTGEALVGNMGARDRMQYTCLGPCVNLAARLEGLNKYYGTSILVSDAVRKRASSEFLFRRIDIVEAKGTSIPVTLYELIGERGEFVAFGLSKEDVRRASDYEQAFDFYLHQDFDQAEIILMKLKSDMPDDKVVQYLLERCQAFMKTPPPKGWNGVTSFDKK